MRRAIAVPSKKQAIAPNQPLAKESIMKTLALIMLLMIAVAAPSWVEAPDQSSIAKIRKPNKPSQPYRGGERRDVYSHPDEYLVGV
jgi:hypothetical protein